MDSLRTTAMAPKDVMPFWMDVVCKTYYPVDICVGATAPFQACLDFKKIGRIQLTHVKSSDVSYDRTRANIIAGKDDDYLVTLLIAGEQYFSQAGRSARCAPGDLCLFDGGRNYELRYTPYESIHLKVPRADFDSRLPRAETVSGMRVASCGRYAQLASTMLRSTFDTVSHSDTPPAILGSTLLDLVALAFDECFNGLSIGDTRYSRIVDRAKEVIMDNLMDPDFEVSTVPATIGVSTRTLSRACAQRGMTPSKWLWTKRLEAAFNMLQSAKSRSVSEIAMTCGFNDFSHFSRAFKLRYNETPTSIMGRKQPA